MGLAIQSEPIPLRVDSDGSVRIGGTRVTLDTVISAHLHGAAPQDIARQYPAIQLADIYAVPGYYLRHTSAVDAYLRERQQPTRFARRWRLDSTRSAFAIAWNSAANRQRSKRCVPLPRMRISTQISFKL